MSKDEEFVLDRIDRPSRSVIEQYVCESKPFVITGTAKDWPAYNLWKDPQYLIDKVGKSTLVPVRTHFIKYSNPEEWLGEAKEIPFAQFMEHWLQKKTWSMYFFEISHFEKRRKTTLRKNITTWLVYQ